VWTARKKLRRQDKLDKLAGFTSTSSHNGATQTSPGESRVCPLLDYELSGPEFSSEQAAGTVNGIECGRNSGSGSELPRAGIEIEHNVSVMLNANHLLTIDTGMVF